MCIPVHWSGSYVLNSTKGKRERIGRILQMHANHREEISTVYSGDIAAAVGLKDTTTGETLCDEKHPIILESMEFPEPVISIAIEPKTKSDQDKMAVALAKLAEEDPTFKTQNDEETGQTIISGMGELHLDIIVDRLKREFKVEANVGAPQVAYKETFRSSAKWKENLCVSPVDVVNMVMYGSNSNRLKKVPDLNLSTKLSVGLFRKNTSRPYKAESKKPCKMVYWLDIRWLTSMRPCRRFLPRCRLLRNGL